MRAATIIQFVALASVQGCGSPEKDAYERLAREANPILAAMKPAAKRLLSVAPTPEQKDTLKLPPDQAKAIVSACESADEQLWTIRNIDFDRAHIAPAHGKASVAEYAGWLLDHRNLTCRHPGRTEMCAFWCSGNWKGLIDEVERLHQEAAKHGVNLTSLREMHGDSPRGNGNL